MRQAQQQLASYARRQSRSLWSGCAMQASPRRRYATASRAATSASSSAAVPAAAAIIADSCSTAAWASALACAKTVLTARDAVCAQQ